METGEYTNIRSQDTSHFYYRTMAKFVDSFLEMYCPPKPRTILDAGCGTGYLFPVLQRYGKVVCVDIHQEAVKIARDRGIDVTRASVTKLPFKRESFDTVVSIDVLYHNQVSDDEKALAEFFRVLKPGGILILRVPAHQHLYSSHDAYVHAARRYSLTDISEKITRSGFLPAYTSYSQLILYPLSLLQTMLEKGSRFSLPKSSIRRVHPLINRILFIALVLEVRIQKWISLPIGIGICIVARKPGVVRGSQIASSQELG